LSRVVVVGSINIDLVATVDRFPRAGETVPGRGLHRYPGGKGANQAVAAARLAAATMLLGAVGDDAFGGEMLAFLASMAVDLHHVRVQPGMPTGMALITVCEGENTIVVVPGANATVAAGAIEAMQLRADDILLCQLEVPIDTVAAAIGHARRCGATSILNPAPALAAADRVVADCDLLILNEVELSTFARLSIGDDTPLPVIAHAAQRLRAFASQIIIVTLGRRGAIVSLSDRWIHEPGRNAVVVDTTGAGDCFCGALAAALARGAMIEAAVKFANAAASIAVQRMGAGPGMPSLNEVEPLLFAS